MRKHTFNAKRTFMLLILGTVVHVSLAFAQQDKPYAQLKAFVQNINTFNTLLPQEKVYLHLDNSSYFVGEHIWFKAYVVNPIQNLPTTMSKVLYVEFLNQQGCIFQTKKLKIENGQCTGDFTLSDSLFGGYYEIRAYTRYMLNFEQTARWVCSPIMHWGYYGETTILDLGISSWGYYWEPYLKDAPHLSRWLKDKGNPYYESKYVFSRVIPVYDKPAIQGAYDEKFIVPRSWEQSRVLTDLKPLLKLWTSRSAVRDIGLGPIPNLVSEIPSAPKLTVTFFPEGGYLIKGHASTIAFKAFDAEGKDVSLSGIVVDSKNNQRAVFHTFQRGMGSFLLCPIDTGEYTARIVYNNELLLFKLPPCLDAGYALTLKTLNSTKTIGIEIQNCGLKQSDLLGISIQCRGAISWFDTVRISDQERYTFSINPTALSKGVNELCLFNSKGEIFASRMFFVNKVEASEITIKTLPLKSEYKPFEPIKLSLFVRDKNGLPVQTHFSMSVSDQASADQTFYTDRMDVNLLLSSELKGYLPDPAYFLESDDSTHRMALDLLLLTQGWKRYSWKKMAGIETFKMTEPVEKGLMIDGFTYLHEEHYELKTIKKNGRYEEIDSFYYVNTLLPDVNLSYIIGQTDTMVLTGNQRSGKDGAFQFQIPDFTGRHRSILEMSRKTDSTKALTKPNLILRLISSIKSTKIDFSTNLMASINRFPLLPKSSFSYYETTTIKKDAYTEPELPQRTGTLKDGLQLKAIEIKGKRKGHYANPDLTHPDFSISGDEILEMLSDRFYTGKMALLPVLDEIIHKKYRFLTDEHDFFVNGLLATNRLFRGSPFANGYIASGSTQMSEQFLLNNLESVSIFLGNSPRLPFQYSYPGAYVLINKKNGTTRMNLENARRILIDGYSEVSDFYHPDYSNGVPPQTRDFRRTLYWNPNVQTDSSGKAIIQFYNNASCQKLCISAEGLTEEGIPFSMH